MHLRAKMEIGIGIHLSIHPPMFYRLEYLEVSQLTLGEGSAHAGQDKIKVKKLGVS